MYIENTYNRGCRFRNTFYFTPTSLPTSGLLSDFSPLTFLYEPVTLQELHITELHITELHITELHITELHSIGAAYYGEGSGMYFPG